MDAIGSFMKLARRTLGINDQGELDHVTEDSAYINVTMPFDLNVPQFLQANGLTGIRSVFITATNPDVQGLEGVNFAQSFRKIKGNSTITCPDSGVQLSLSLRASFDFEGVDVGGIAYQSDIDPNSFHLQVDGADLEVNTNGTSANGIGKVAISNRGNSHYDDAGNLAGTADAIEFKNVVANNATQANSIQRMCGLYPNTAAALAQAPYLESLTLPYLANGDGKIYEVEGGNFCAFVQDDNVISRLTFNERGMLVKKSPAFDYSNTGPKLVAKTDAEGNPLSDGNGDPILEPSTEIPYDGQPLETGETFVVNDFATERLPDGSVTLAVSHSRYKSDGLDVTKAEAVGNLIVFAKNGQQIAGMRDITYYPDNSIPAFNKKIRRIGQRGLTADDDFFIAFSKGGALRPADIGLFVNGTNPQEITHGVSADFPTLATPSRTEVQPEHFAKINFVGGQLQVNSLYDPNHELDRVAKTTFHVVEGGEHYQAGSPPSAEGNDAPHIVYIPPEANGSVVTFLPGNNYVLIGQGTNSSLIFPAVPDGAGVPLEESTIDGVVTTVAHFPGNTNVTFVGEDIDYVQEYVIGQLSTVATTSTTTLPSTTTLTSTATEPEPESTTSEEPTSSTTVTTTSTTSSMVANYSSSTTTAIPMFNTTVAIGNHTTEENGTTPGGGGAKSANTDKIIGPTVSVGGTALLLLVLYGNRHRLINPAIRLRNFVARPFGIAPIAERHAPDEPEITTPRPRTARVTPAPEGAEVNQNLAEPSDSASIKITRLETDEEDRAQDIDGQDASLQQNVEPARRPPRLPPLQQTTVFIQVAPAPVRRKSVDVEASEAGAKQSNTDLPPAPSANAQQPSATQSSSRRSDTSRGSDISSKTRYSRHLSETKTS